MKNYEKKKLKIKLLKTLEKAENLDFDLKREKPENKEKVLIFEEEKLEEIKENELFEEKTREIVVLEEKTREILEKIEENPLENKEKKQVFDKEEFFVEKPEILEKLNERVEKLLINQEFLMKKPENMKPKAKKVKKSESCDIFLNFCRRNYLKTRKNQEKTLENLEKSAKSLENRRKSFENQRNSLENQKNSLENQEKPLETNEPDFNLLRKELKEKKLLFKALKAEKTLKKPSENSISSLIFSEFDSELAFFEPKLKNPENSQIKAKIPLILLRKSETFLEKLQKSYKEKVPIIDPFFYNEMKAFLYKNISFSIEKSQKIEPLREESEYEKIKGFLMNILAEFNAKKLILLRNQEKLPLKTLIWTSILSILSQFHEELIFFLKKT